MKNNNNLELVGLVLALIGFLSFLSQKFFYIETLKNAYGLGDFFMALGLILIFIANRKKRKAEMENTK